MLLALETMPDAAGSARPYLPEPSFSSMAPGAPFASGLSHGHQDGLWSATIQPRRQRIRHASSDKTARLWDAATGKPIGEPLKGHAGGLLSAAFQP